jgi:hypothetical protein
MSLALVQVDVSEFNQIFHHLTTHTKYRNMHLREARQHNKRRVLRYLHAMYPTRSGVIDGMISGPGVFWQYTLSVVRGQTQINVLAHNCSLKDSARIQTRFLPEIMRRMAQEQTKQSGFPKLTPGQFYLRRHLPGMHHGHANCQAAVQSGALDQRFVSALQGWNLSLLHA